jgi:acetyl-CoA C-acetyltransferase
MLRNKRVFLVDGLRTPFLKFPQYGPFSGGDLAVQAGKALLNKNEPLIDKMDEIIIGSVGPVPQENNIARSVAMRLGLDYTLPAWTVQTNCATGVLAIHAGVRTLQDADVNIVLVGGADATSRGNFSISGEYINWLIALSRAHSLQQRLRLLAQWRPRYLKVYSDLVEGSYDHYTGTGLFALTEILLDEFSITKDDLDAIRLRSNQRAALAQDEGYFCEVTPIFDNNGQVYDKDTAIDREVTLESLQKLPALDGPYAIATMGHMVHLVDGAAMVILASEKAVEKYQLNPLCEIVDSAFTAASTTHLGQSLAYSTDKLLNRNALQLRDIDFWEFYEASASFPIVARRLLASDEKCQQYLGRKTAWGEIKEDQYNVDGGLQGLGHAFGATGVRYVLHMAHILRRNQAQYGMVHATSIAGQSGGVLVRNVFP